MTTTPADQPVETAERELDRQLETLVGKGYPALAGLDDEAVRRHVRALLVGLPDAKAASDPGRIPLLVVIPGVAGRPGEAMERVALGGKHGFADTRGADLDAYRTIAGLAIPPGPAYLLTDVDLGSSFLGVTPDDALVTIAAGGRSPLTIDEGLALAVLFPERLESDNAFSMLGSRSGDRRVTAIWLSRGRPRLGWCWAGNPHTWLGSASCGGRLGVENA